jgi:hypothetical protein
LVCAIQQSAGAALRSAQKRDEFALLGTNAEHVWPEAIWIPTPDTTQLELNVQVIGPGAWFASVKLT